jgi:hypothetical protein
MHGSEIEIDVRRGNGMAARRVAKFPCNLCIGMSPPQRAEELLECAEKPG